MIPLLVYIVLSVAPPHYTLPFEPPPRYQHPPVTTPPAHPAPGRGRP